MLRAHQVAAVEFLRQRRRAFLCDDPGLGKTAAALTAIPDATRTVVCCPTSVIGTWQHEAARWRPDLAVRVQKTKRDGVAPCEGEILVTTYDRLDVSVAPDIDVLILDESHAVKNAKTQRSKRVRATAKMNRELQIWALTGTPILRDPEDLWGQLTSIDLHPYGTWPAFLRAWGGSPSPFGTYWRKTPPERCWVPMEPYMLRRRRGDVLDLPDRTYTELWIDLGTKLRREHSEMAAQYDPEDDRWDSWASAGQLATVLAEMASRKAKAIASDIPTLFDPTTYRPIVVFSPYRAALTELSARFGWPQIHGGVSQAQRQKTVDAFQAGEHAGLLCTIGAGGVGLTLTRASTVVFLGRHWTPALNSQAEDRVYRIGQERAVTVVQVRCESDLERAVDKVLARKAAYV